MDADEIENLRKRIHYTKSKRSMDFKSSFLTKIRESEANQLTVTRLAGNDEIFKKQVKIYHSDMSSTVNDITRQQKLLRRSMKIYSKKLKQGKKERKNREKPPQDIKTISSENLPLDIIAEEPEVRSDCGIMDTEKSILENNLSDRNEVTGEDVQANTEGETINSENATEGKDDNIALENATEEKNNIIALENVTEGNGTNIASDRSIENTPMTTLTQNLQSPPNDFVNKTKIDDSLMKDIDIKLYSNRKRRKRKPAVCYSDLVKLQHSTNRRQLLGLVDKLAKLHGISDNQFKSSNQISKPPSSEPLRRNSLYYTINYGYDVPDDDEGEKVDKQSKGDDVTVGKDKSLSTPLKDTEPRDNHIFSDADNAFWREIHRERLSRQSFRSNQLGDTFLKSRGKLYRDRQKELPLVVGGYVSMDKKVPSCSRYKSSEKTGPTSNILYQRRYMCLPPITNISK